MRLPAILLLLALSTGIDAQQKHVLLEEFTGAHCGICPNGAYYTDSMLTMHPSLITVAVHTYGIYDAMVFPAIDTIGQAFAAGAPLGAVDRICSSPPSTNTGVYINQWDAAIAQQELQWPSLTVSVLPSWNNTTRNITATVTVNILADLPAGDYRISLYVVEDSVTGTGSGYDQANLYDQVSGSPWYGLGDPIVGYVHRHVARALLPGAWGRPGVIPSAPTTGQTFNTTFTYTLPAGYDENHVSLVAFVNEVSSDHSGDEVLNAVETDLMNPTGTDDYSATGFNVYSPSSGTLVIENAPAGSTCEFYDVTGRLTATEIISPAGSATVTMNNSSGGIYFVVVRSEAVVSTRKVFVTVRN